MKKYLIFIGIALACIGIGIGAGIFIDRKYFSKPGKPDLGKPGEPIHGTYPVKDLTTTYKGRASSNLIPYGGYIKIEPKLNVARDILRIHAYDKYKFTDQDFPIKCSPAPVPFKKHIIGIEAMALVGYNRAIKSIDALYGGGLNYTRMFGGTFGVGGGIIVLHGMMSQDTYYGAKINMLAQFGKQE